MLAVVLATRFETLHMHTFSYVQTSVLVVFPAVVQLYLCT